MAYPEDDSGEEFVEKLGRAEDEVRREEGAGFKRIVLFYVIIALLLGVGMAAVLAAEPPSLSQSESDSGGYVMLTRPDGTAIYVNPHAVAFIRGPLEGERGHTTIVFASGAKQTVQETVEEISEIMKRERMPPSSEIPP